MKLTCTSLLLVFSLSYSAFSAQDAWISVLDENFSDTSGFKNWIKDGSADLSIGTTGTTKYLQIKTIKATGTNLVQSTLWYKNRLSGDIRVQMRVKADAGNRCLFFFNARPTAKYGFTSIFDWTRPDAQYVRYAQCDSIELYSLGYLRTDQPDCNLRYIGGVVSRVQTLQGIATFDTESIYSNYPFTYQADTWYEFDLQVIGPRLTLSINGTKYMDVADTGNAGSAQYKWTPLSGGGWLAIRNFAANTQSVDYIRIFQSNSVSVMPDAASKRIFTPHSAESPNYFYDLRGRKLIISQNNITKSPGIRIDNLKKSHVDLSP